MNKRIQLSIIFFSIFYCAGSIYAQQFSVGLSGTYQLDTVSGTGFYDAFVFDGEGKVSIHAGLEFRGDFFQVGDTVVIYPDKDVFTFLRRDEQTLEGLNSWVEGQVFKRMENDTVVVPTQERDPDYAVQFYRFYVLTGRDGLSLFTYMEISTDSALQASMRELCEEGFPKACITMANTLMIGRPEVIAYLRGASDEGEVLMSDKNIVAYFTRAIELGEWDAIAQLGAYYLMLGDKDEAKRVFEKGCDLGHLGSCLSLAGLEWDVEGE